MRICVGLASGIGNTLFALPTLQTLRNAGHEIVLWVDADYPGLVDLWRRCIYVSDVIDGSILGTRLPQVDRYISGHWRPRAMRDLAKSTFRWYRWTDEPNYREPEWSLFLQAARDLGCTIPKRFDVTAWCRDLRRDPTIDVGIIQGSKPGPVWERKRYEGMPAVIADLRRRDKRVVLFGTRDDGYCENGIEDWRDRFTLAQLPDALASCRVVIGTDSGPTHLAASLGIPTVFVFTATSRVKGEPVGNRWRILQTNLYCQPCQATPRWSACHEWECQRIASADVVNVAEALRL